MARNITLTLGSGLGADLGPNFNLTANFGSVTPSTATKTELLTGKSVSVDDSATQITVTSTGTCTNAITQTIPCVGTTTTTTTSAPTTTTTTTTEAPTTTTTTTTGSPFVFVFVNNSSFDVPINDVTINGVSITWVAGGDGFPLPSGENGDFTSTQLGTQNVVIYYGGHIPGQNISFTDSNNIVQCQNLNGSSGTFTITGATITGGTTIYITASDGDCS